MRCVVKIIPNNNSCSNSFQWLCHFFRMAHRDETTKCYLRQLRAFTQYIYMHMYGWMDGRMYGCMDVWMYACLYVCMSVCLYVSMSLCLLSHSMSLCVCMCMYMYKGVCVCRCACAIYVYNNYCRNTCGAEVLSIMDPVWPSLAGFASSLCQLQATGKAFQCHPQ